MSWQCESEPVKGQMDLSGKRVRLKCERLVFRNIHLYWYLTGNTIIIIYIAQINMRIWIKCARVFLTEFSFLLSLSNYFTFDLLNCDLSYKSNVNLILTDKPSGITISTSAAQNTVIQGQNVTLTCHVIEANPAVSRYGFYRNDSLLVSTTNVNKFILRNVKRSQHFGEYKCEAHNDAGDGQSRPVVLNINSKSFSKINK